MNNKVICNICGKEFSKYGIGAHIWRMHGEGINHDPNRGYEDGTREIWNKGLTKDTNERVKQYGETLSKRITDGIIIPSFTGNHHTDEFKENARHAAIKNKLGGHTSKRSIYYKKKNDAIVYLQSSYEIKVAESLDLNNIEWTRPSYILWKDINDIEHRYYPDFYIPMYNVYLDPKNDFLQLKDKEKIEAVQRQNNIRIFVLSKNELDWNIIKNKIADIA